MAMKDEQLLELKTQISALKNKNNDYCTGFSHCFDIMADLVGEPASELQRVFIQFLKADVGNIHLGKLSHSSFKHIVK